MSQSPEGNISISLRGTATIHEATAKLAEHFQVSIDYIHLSVNDSALKDRDQLIWSIKNPINCLTSQRKVTFTFNHKRFSLAVDPEIVIINPKALVQREHQIGFPFVLMASESEVDDEMNLSDLEIISKFAICSIPVHSLSSSQVQSLSDKPKPAPVPPEPSCAFQVTLVLGVISRIITVALPPSSTLHEAEVEVRKKFNFERIDFEFVLIDVDTDGIQRVSKDYQLPDFRF